MTILVCAFKANSTKSLSYTRYVNPENAARAVLRIFKKGEADYISVRIVRTPRSETSP